MKPRILALLIFLLSLFGAIYQHAPWRDEYQSWLVATNSESFPAFIEGIRYERHPPLHYLIQRFNYSFGSDFLSTHPKFAIEMITVPFTLGTAILLLFAFKLSILQSVLIVFSCYLFREYGTISRVYSLGVFFLIAAALTKHSRFKQYFSFLLLLAASTHLLFTLVAGAFWCLERWDSRRSALRETRTYAVLAGFLALVAFQIPPADSMFNRKLAINLDTARVFLRFLNQTFWGLEKIWEPFRWNSMATSTDFSLLLLPVALLWIHSRVDIRRVLFVITVPLLLLATSYDTAPRHLGVLFFGWLATYLAFRRPEPVGWFRKWPEPITVIGLILTAGTVNWLIRWAPWQTQPNFDFSDSARLAATLPELKHDDSLLLANTEVQFFSWMALANKPVFSIERDKWMNYPKFTTIDRAWSVEDWCREKLPSFQNGAGNKKIYFGLPQDMQLPQTCGDADLVYKTSRPIVTDESYAIYKLK